MEKNILVITGGTSGLGREITIQAISRGLYVCNLSRNKEKAEKLDLILKNNYKSFIGDITNANFVSDSFKKISKLGQISYLINSAEKACFKSPIEYTNEDIDISLTGLKGMILCSTETLKISNEKDLRIVNIMSSAALKGNKNEALYCSAKWGERGYTESLKAAYKGSSVKVIGVYPGGMNTEFWNNNRNYVSEEKSNSFMNPASVATVILDNILNYRDLNVADIIIERN